MGFKDFFNNIFNSNKEADCMKVLDMLDSILDNEVNEADKKQFHAHIEDCMWCYERYNLDKSMKELIKLKCGDTVPEGLVESIKLQISQSESN